MKSIPAATACSRKARLAGVSVSRLVPRPIRLRRCSRSGFTRMRLGGHQREVTTFLRV